MGRDSGEDCEVEVGKAVGRMLGRRLYRWRV